MSGQQLAVAFLAVIGSAWIFSKIGRAGGIALLVLIAPIVAVFGLVHGVQSFTGTVRVATVQASSIANALLLEDWQWDDLKST